MFVYSPFDRFCDLTMPDVEVSAVTPRVTMKLALKSARTYRTCILGSRVFYDLFSAVFSRSPRHPLSQAGSSYVEKTAYFFVF